MTTPTDLDALRALNAERTPGTYRVTTSDWTDDDRCEGIVSDKSDEAIVVTDTGHYGPTRATAEWLVAISNAGPGLVEEVARLRARVAELEAIIEVRDDIAWERSERD